MLANRNWANKPVGPTHSQQCLYNNTDNSLESESLQARY